MDQLLNDYIEEYIEIYGEHTITSNVHNLCHLLDDVKRFGNLNTISTYPFENCLQVMKMKLRSRNNPLQQVSRRFSEIASALDHQTPYDFDNRTFKVELKFPQKNDQMKFQVVMFGDFRLSSKKIGDQWFMDKKNRIIMFKYAIEVESNVLLYGHEIVEKRNFFTHPFSSSKINIYISDGKRTNETVCDIENIKCKLVCFSRKSEFVFQPLLHTLQ